MLDVIGAGWGRTGTNSLQLALEKLGFGPCYHMVEVIKNASHVERWRHVLSEGPTDWDRVFEGYRSTVDWPAAAYWRELAEAYPAAKVVLSVRDPERWHASARSTIFSDAIRRDGLGDGGAEADEFTTFMREELAPRIMLDSQGVRVDKAEKETAIKSFLRHNEEVKNTIPADRLLVFQASEGWGPLCEFLEVPVPDEEFPHTNDSGNFHQLARDAFAQRVRPSTSGSAS